MCFLRWIQTCFFLLYFGTFTLSLYGQTFKSFVKETDTIEKHNTAYQLFNYYLANDLDSLKVLGNELLAFSNKQNYKSGVYLSYHILGDYFVESGQEVKGIGWLLQAKNYYFTQQDYNNLTLIYNAIGTGYHRQGMYQKAIDCYQRSLLYGELASDVTITNIAQNNMGKALMKLKKYEQARHEVKEFKKWARKQNEYALLANASSVLGEIAIEEKKYEVAINHFIECQQFAKQQNNNAMRAVAYTNMGIVYFLKEDFQNSEKNFFKALEIRKKIKTISSLCDAYLNCGGILFEQGKNKEAIQLYQEGEKTAYKYKKYRHQIELLEALQEAYQGDPKQLEAIETQLVNAHLNLEKQKEENEKQDNLINHELEQSQVVQANTLKNKNMWLTVATIVILSLSVVIYIQKKQKYTK